MGIKEGTISVLNLVVLEALDIKCVVTILEFQNKQWEKYDIHLPDRELACVPNTSEKVNLSKSNVFCTKFCME